MKRVLSVLIAALFLLTALPMMALAASYTITVTHNDGGVTGYNTTGSSTEFTEIASGGTFQVNEHSGMTIGALPNGGYTVTEIYLDGQPIGADWVYLSEGGRFVVDNGDINENHEVRFVFDTDDHDSFVGTGAPPLGPGDPDQPGEPVFNSRILFSLEDDYGWYIEPVFGDIGEGFVNNEHLLEIPCTSGADVRVRIEPQQKNDPEYGDYYPHLGSMVITDQNGNEVRPYYRMNDVTPENDPTRFTFETTIQNVQGEVHVTLSKGDEWHGTIINDFLSGDLSFLKEDKQLDDVINVDLTTGQATYLPELANMMGGKGVYKIGDVPAEIANGLIAIGFSADDDFIEITENEFGDAVNVTLLLTFDKPFEKTWTGEYSEWHNETETVKVLVNMKGNEPNFDTDAMNNDLVQAQFDTNAGETFDLRFDYLGVKSKVQRRPVMQIHLHTDATVTFGDVDGDSNITMKDVLLLRKFIARLVDENQIDRAAADVDFDGNITMKDVLLIRKFIAHLIDGFDPPKSGPDNSEQNVSLEPYELPPMAL